MRVSERWSPLVAVRVVLSSSDLNTEIQVKLIKLCVEGAVMTKYKMECHVSGLSPRSDFLAVSPNTLVTITLDVQERSRNARDLLMTAYVPLSERRGNEWGLIGTHSLFPLLDESSGPEMMGAREWLVRSELRAVVWRGEV